MENPEQKNPDVSSVDDIERPPEQVGEHSRLVLGSPEYLGYVDAPHAKILSREAISHYVYTDDIVTRNGSAKPAKSKVYLNERVRGLLGVNVGDTITIDDGTEIKVEGARKIETSGRYCPVVVHPDNREAVIEVIKDKVNSDKFTGQIARQIGEKDISYIEGTSSRGVCDINRWPDYKNTLDKKAQKAGNLEYRKFKAQVLNHAQNMGEGDEALKPFLHIALHGKKNYDPRVRDDSDIEIGTVNGQSCSEKVLEWFEEKFKEKMTRLDIEIDGRELKIKTDVRLSGHPSKMAGAQAHGVNFNTIQLEIAYALRKNYQAQITAVLSEIITEFTEEKKSSEDEEVAGQESKAEEEHKQEEQEIVWIEKSMTARKQFKDHAGTVGISKQLAEELDMEDGDLIHIKNLNGSIIVPCKIFKRLKTEVVLLGKKDRTDLGVSDNEETDFSISKI
ncbi:MAG: hypothetical protein CMI52_01915 [Parcubacteria group bacterium]|nr:hypothetical protein [Parcubacteria group bacterium]